MSASNVFDVELEALKSIYDDDLFVEEDSIAIRVHPLQNGPKNDDFDAQIVLQVSCPENYPEMLPNISFKNCRGLSNKQISLLTSELKILMKSLQGKPMIYDLACHVLSYLLDNNKPRRKSFYDEMMCRKQQEEAKFKLDEDRRMKRMYDVQKKFKMKTAESSSDGESESDVLIQNSENLVKVPVGNNDYDIENNVLCIPSMCCSSKYIHFQKKVLRGCCTEHYECRTAYCALNTTNGEQLTVHEWILKPGQQCDDIERLLKSIQNELNYLKILNHENLSSYVDFKCISDRDEWTIYIAEKFISNITLKTFLKQCWLLGIDFVQNIVESILKGISYLHEHKVAHKQLNDSNIFFSGSGKIIISSYSVIQKMDDITRLCHNINKIDKKADQKADIKQLGLLLKTVLELTAKATDEIEISDYKLLEFKDFIEKCLIKNEERRWGAKELLEHKFLKNNLLYEPSGKRKLSHRKVSFEENDETQVQFDFPIKEQHSRLLKDFCILEDVGKGSFGKVLKVQNKLDSQIYAIKEIKLNKNSKQLDKKIIGEVKLLSKLKHENVVRYYTSWIETYSEADNLIGSKEQADEDGVEEEDEDEDEDEDDDDDDDEDDDDSSSGGFWQRNDKHDGTSFVIFEDEKNPSKIVSSENEDIKVNNALPSRILYIQMEYCEKSTLKYAIKNNLYEQDARSWRLLREIVEGLTYIHGQGLIHRDLKPDNIFLDSNDHVKIGDFGLAKIRGISKCSLIITDVSLGGGYNTQGDSDTVGVGTSYYVAPEISRIYERAHYNEKVDIYSLGIIFFEMCHPPFSTGMERHEVLTKLRKCEIVIPGFIEEKMPRQMELVRMLLNSDPMSRPSSQEILDDFVPPAEVEFEELKEIVRKTLMSPETKSYKYLISSCLNQKMAIDEDITYQLQNTHSDKFYISMEMAKDPIENIFKSHGAVYLPTPLLLPQSQINQSTDSRVRLMTHSGAVVNLSYDLRIPFARYITSKNIRSFRRYTTDRIHREQRVHGVFPKELYECAFDIVSPKIGNLADEWEILTIIDEVFNSIPSLKNRHCIILINHALILRALLIYCNAEKLYSEIFGFLMDAKIHRHGKRQLEANLLSLQLGIHSVNVLLTFFNKEDTVYALKEELSALFNNRREAYKEAEKGFGKLVKIIEEIENFDINIPVRMRLGVVCNSENCCDIMFDVVCKTKQKRGNQCTDVIMSGCRYDGLLRSFRKTFSVMNVDFKETCQSAIGISIYLDKIAHLLKEDNLLSEYVVVYSTDSWIPNKAKASFIRELREAGIKCHLEDTVDNMEELLGYCGENKIKHIVNLKEENGMVLIMSWDSGKCRYRDKKVSKREVVEYLLKNSKLSDDQGGVTCQRWDLRTTTSETSTIVHSFNIHILVEEKSLTRRKYENQIRSKISPLLRYFSSKSRIEVVGVELDEDEISRLAMSYKHEDSSYKSKILSIADRSSKKAYLSKICIKLDSLFTPEKTNLIMILYGLSNEKYQIIMS